jgi:serine/threonine protein kinase
MLVTPKLRLVRPLGSGGMGAVWLADHLALRTQVVVKFVREQLAWSPEATARFAREAAAASQVKSPHVVQMLDHGVSEAGLPYIVMELLEGHDLADHLSSGGLPPREVVAIVTQLCRALARAHEVGIVHRDVKPSNVFLCQVGGGELFVKLLDFGVAKRPADEGGAGDQTRSGALLGSPVYMSPEQLMGQKGVDYRSDLWSVGVLAFEALTGARPHEGETVGALTMHVHAAERPRPSQKNPMLPVAIDAWFARACALDPGARFQGAKELAEALAEALGETAPRGISLEQSGARAALAALADTASAPSASSGDYARSARSQPSAPSATGSGIATSEPLKRESSWRPMVLVGLGALAVGVGTTRWAGSRNTGAPTTAAPLPTSRSAWVAERLPDATPDAAAASGLPFAPALSPDPSGAPSTAGAPTTKPRPHSLAPPSPSARPAPSSVRAQGSDDDIR